MACFEVGLLEFVLQFFGISSYKRDGIGPLHTPYQAQFARVSRQFSAISYTMGDFATTGNASL